MGQGASLFRFPEEAGFVALLLANRGYNHGAGALSKPGAGVYTCIQVDGKLLRWLRIAEVAYVDNSGDGMLHLRRRIGNPAYLPQHAHDA
jgi:hypothetical protein